MHNAEFLSEMRERLEAEQKELSDRQRKTIAEIEAVKNSDAGIHDSIDTTMLEQTTATLLKLKERELLRLREINLALQRIDDGSYGICEETEELISPARLRANPLARLSVDAQRDREHEEARWNFRPGLMDDMH